MIVYTSIKLLWFSYEKHSTGPEDRQILYRSSLEFIALIIGIALISCGSAWNLQNVWSLL